MKRVVTNSVKTLVFCISTATIKTRIHFFPSAGSAGGHLPVSCTLTLFGKGVEKRSVMIDGGRLNQPDGLRLEDAFPALRGEVSGVFGLEIQLACPQGRINLLNSQTAVEFVSSASSMLYGGVPFAPILEEVSEESLQSVAENSQPAQKRSPAAVAVQDATLTSSLVIINAASETLKPELAHVTGLTSKPLHLGTLSPESVVEVPLDEALFKESAVRETLAGTTRVEKMVLPDMARTPESSYYILYRDPTSKRPVSVCSI